MNVTLPSILPPADGATAALLAATGGVGESFLAQLAGVIAPSPGTPDGAGVILPEVAQPLPDLPVPARLAPPVSAELAGLAPRSATIPEAQPTASGSRALPGGKSLPVARRALAAVPLPVTSAAGPQGAGAASPAPLARASRKAEPASPQSAPAFDAPSPVPAALIAPASSALAASAPEAPIAQAMPADAQPDAPEAQADIAATTQAAILPALALPVLSLPVRPVELPALPQAQTHKSARGLPLAQAPQTSRVAQPPQGQAAPLVEQALRLAVAPQSAQPTHPAQALAPSAAIPTPLVSVAVTLPAIAPDGSLAAPVRASLPHAAVPLAPVPMANLPLAFVPPAPAAAAPSGTLPLRDAAPVAQPAPGAGPAITPLAALAAPEAKPAPTRSAALQSRDSAPALPAAPATQPAAAPAPLLPLEAPASLPAVTAPAFAGEALPRDIELTALVDRLVETRLTARAERPTLDLPHPDFGRVTLALSLREDQLAVDLPDAPAELRSAVGQAFAPSPRSDTTMAGTPASAEAASTGAQPDRSPADARRHDRPEREQQQSQTGERQGETRRRAATTTASSDHPATRRGVLA